MFLLIMRTRTASLHRSGWKNCSLITREVQMCLKQRHYPDLSARRETLTVRDELTRGAVCWSDEVWQAFYSPVHYLTYDLVWDPSRLALDMRNLSKWPTIVIQTTSIINGQKKLCQRTSQPINFVMNWITFR